MYVLNSGNLYYKNSEVFFRLFQLVLHLLFALLMKYFSKLFLICFHEMKYFMLSCTRIQI